MEVQLQLNKSERMENYSKEGKREYHWSKADGEECRDVVVKKEMK
jgi:hypothetical protein